MSEVARGLLQKLLAQADRGGRETLPITQRHAASYFADGSLAARERIQAVLQNAAQAGAISLEWGKGAAARDLLRLRLRDADRLAGFLGVTRSADRADALAKRLTPLLQQAPDWLNHAYQQALSRWRLGKPCMGVTHDQPDEAEQLLRIALAVSRDEQIGLDLRRFSVELLGDSKAVERRFSRLAGLLRHNPEWAEFTENSELFRALGLEKFPPPVYLKGPLRLSYRTVDWDISELRPFVGLSPDAVTALRTTAAIPYVLSIENLASFQRHVREVDDQAIVLYTAGFPAPALLRLLGLLNTALPADCPVRHWGDRDLGGLRIFAKLIEGWPGRELRPHLMNQPGGDKPFEAQQLKTLERYRQTGGAAGRLAGEWLDDGLGMMEQEGIGPVGPSRKKRLLD